MKEDLLKIMLAVNLFNWEWDKKENKEEEKKEASIKVVQARKTENGWEFITIYESEE